MIGPFHMLAHCTTSFGPLAAPILWLSRIFGNFSFKTFSEQTAKVIEIRKKQSRAEKKRLAPESHRCRV
uniref:Uncharacterized protein n=2 Tax=Ixodes ricinus TaxID=34613 RepID=V5GJ88_IXORI